MAYATTASSEPLAAALNEIVRLVACPEADAEVMIDLLNSIIETAERGKIAYRDNVMSAQRVELEALRAKAKQVPA